MKELGEKVLGFVVLGVVFLVVNLVLGGVQDLWHHGGREKLAQHKLAVDAHRQTLDRQEQVLDATKRVLEARAAASRSLGKKLDARKSVLTELRTRIEATEKRYPRGIPPALYGKYQADLKKHNHLVREFNSLADNEKVAYAEYSKLLAEYNASVTTYDGDVTTFNQEVKAVNKLASDAGSNFYVVPAFGGRRRR